MNTHGLEKILKTLGSNFLSFGERGFVYGPQGRLLRRNMESLWFAHCVTMPPYNVFLTTSDKLSETLQSLGDSSMDTRPLGLAAIEDSKTAWNQDLCHVDSKAVYHRIGKVCILADEENAKNMYHRKQRERKVWWRKLSRYPSRFALSEAKKISKNRETIDITAEFDFGNVILETIIYQQDTRKIYPQMLVSVRIVVYSFYYRLGTEKARRRALAQLVGDQKEKNAEVHMIEHIASLDWGCLTMLCDAFEVTGDTAELKLDPKLSPYKVGFYLENTENQDDEKSQQKSRLILYLNNLLKSKGLETVLTRSKHGIETFHVPLTVTVDDASLQNGLVNVTSQLTTIAEAVHVTDLPKYVAARCA